MRIKHILLLAFLLCCGTAAAQEIRSVDVSVYINNDGDAYIRQVWDVNVVRGTEWYIPIGNLGPMQIRGLSVKENGQDYIDEGRTWDTDRTLEQKAGRCGIVEKRDGVELCWGQGSYGDHVWTVGFVALGLVQSLQDYDAFNFMFVNPDLIAPVQHASVTFSRLEGTPFSADSTRFWFFGTDGISELRDDGTIFYETTGPMRGSDSIIGMMRFDKGVFHPDVSRDIKFEKMQKQAFKGSTYKEKKGFWSGIETFEDVIEMLMVGLFVLIIALVALLIIYLILRDIVLKITGHTWSAKYFGATKIKGWAREAPFGGSIPIAAHLLKSGSRLVFASDHSERAIGAYFLKWIQEGIVTPIKAADGHYDLQFPKVEPEFTDNCEKELFKKSIQAAGFNLILEKGEFDSWASKHYNALVNWPKSVVNEGKSKLSIYGPDNIAESAKLLQFKNFLEDFTLSKVREVPEVGLWGQYLVFAQMFGIADKVAQGFAKMYPTEFTQYSQSHGLDSATMCYVVNSWSGTAKRAYSAAYDKKLSAESAARSSSRSSSGFGGYSSRGGGGGYSGG
ncbi:MAG: DUF2207 domain-containing protein, partial [Bacteroidales bacterium]|nr:DUF2207 domain-containing protein [Bacteroidales bacterium]